MMKGEQIGIFGNEPVFFNPITQIVTCKDISVYLKSLIAFEEGDSIRKNLDSKTVITKTEAGYKIGCLEDSTNKFKQLIKIAKQK